MFQRDAATVTAIEGMQKIQLDDGYIGLQKYKSCCTE